MAMGMMANRPSSLVVNTATRHLVVAGSIPIWVTTPQQRERWGVPGSIPGSPRGLVKFGHVMGKGFYWDLNPRPDGCVVTDRSTT